MNSVLNPEAPEFYPALSSVTQEAYTSVNKSIKSSKQLPAGASHNLFKTFTDFNVVTSKLSKNVVVQSNQIIVTELSSVKLKQNDKDYNTEKIIDANDDILDRVNINVDTVCGVNKPSNQFLDDVKPGANVSSWNTKPVIAKIQVGSTTFIGAKNILRPQLSFKDVIDNSESLWVPKISDKPNNIKPLSLNIIYNDQGETVGYEHPYKVELDLYHPPAIFIDPDREPPSFPSALEQTKLTYIDMEAQVDELVTHLMEVKEFAIDVEHHSYRTYQGITCLIQISTNEGGDFIIDALAVREHIHKLNIVFTDPKKLKVFHGAEMDVLWLQRDFGIYIVGLFDTHQAAKTLKMKGLSLKNLLMKYCQVDADKKYQLADWRIRPLPEELVEYARMDTHYLLYIWRQMKAELLEMDSNEPRLLLSVFERSRQICGTTYNKQVVDDMSHLPLYLRSKKSFNSKQMAALKMLFKWRDAQARVLDESTTYLLPNHMLLALAESLPREVQGVNACCSPMPPFVKQNLIVIHRMLLLCRELPLEPQLYQMPSSLSNTANTTQQPSLSYNVHDLSQFPDFVEDQQINLDSAAVYITELYNFKPDIHAFAPQCLNKVNLDIVSDLNADAKLFIPPYDRYRKYRFLAQMEEIKEYKDKEAKISAISKGNELIKQDELPVLHKTKTLIENDNETNENSDLDKTNDSSPAQRKRKISTGKKEQKNLKPQHTTQKEYKKEYKKEIQDKNNKPEGNTNLKSYHYEKANYKMFYEDTEKPSKQATPKFKRRK